MTTNSFDHFFVYKFYFTWSSIHSLKFLSLVIFSLLWLFTFFKICLTKNVKLQMQKTNETINVNDRERTKLKWKSDVFVLGTLKYFIMSFWYYWYSTTSTSLLILTLWLSGGGRTYLFGRVIFGCQFIVRINLQFLLLFAKSKDGLLAR